MAHDPEDLKKTKDQLHQELVMHISEKKKLKARKKAISDEMNEHQDRVDKIVNVLTDDQVTLPGLGLKAA